MTDASHAGNLLFVFPIDDARDGRAPPWTSQQALSADDSRQLPYEVIRFDANSLTIRAANPTAAAGWMAYADVWHPSWRATVNGKPVPVYRANMAYKAIPIEPGENLIELRFGSPLFALLIAIVSANAMFWLVSAVLLGIQDLRISVPKFLSS